MKDISELLRQKQLELSRLEIEVEALRVVAPLLSDDKEPGNDDQPALSRSTALPQPMRVPQAVNATPQPVHITEWEGTKGWP
jgi:hypothetical protein